MNMHGLVSGAIAAVNPQTPATLKTSTGYTTDNAGKRTPAYSTSSILAQAQALTFRDIQQVDSLNLQGTRRAIYVSGDIEGLIRADNKGGDLIIFGNTADVPRPLQNTTWLVAMVLENWPDWVKVAVTLQNGD